MRAARLAAVVSLGLSLAGCGGAITVKAPAAKVTPGAAVSLRGPRNLSLAVAGPIIKGPFHLPILVLAVSDVKDETTFRPLFWDRPEDRLWLRRIWQALDTTPRQPVVPPNIPWTRELVVGFPSGELMQIAPEAGPYWTPDKVILAPVNSTGQPAVVDSKLLYDLVATKLGGTVFPVQRPVRIWMHGRHLTVEGDGVLGRSITIGLSPSFANSMGGTMGPGSPGSFKLTTIPIQDGHYHWTGQVNFQPGWRIFRPVDNKIWSLYWTVHPLRCFPNIYNNCAFSGEGGFALAPPPAVSPVASSVDALSAIAEGAFTQTLSFPYWPKTAGVTALFWTEIPNTPRQGKETARVWAVAGGFEAEVSIDYAGSAGSVDRYQSEWSVGKHGSVREVKASGVPPQNFVDVHVAS